MSLQNQALGGFLWSFIDKVGNQAFQFAITIYLANKLGPEAFGLVGMLAVFILISDALVNSGFSQALVQRSSKVTDVDLSTVFYVNLLIAVFIYSILFFSAPFIADFYNEDELEQASRILFLIIVINSLSVVSRARLTIKIDFKSQTISNTLATALGGIAAIVLAELGYGFWSLVAMALIRSSVSMISLWWFAGQLALNKFSRESLSKLFGFGSRLLVAGLIAHSLNNLYVLLVGRYYDSTRVGYLTQATTITNTLSGIITSVLHGVTYPIMTSVNDDETRMLRIYKQLIQMTFFIAIPSLVGFAIVADNFTELFLTEEWVPIVNLLIFLSLARMITPISAVNMNLLNAIGRSDLFLKVDLIKLPMTLAAILISVPYGIEAVTISIFTTSFISFFVNAYYPGKFYGFGALAQLKATWRIVLAAIVMVCVCYFIQFDNHLVELVLKILLGGASYAVTCILLKEPAAAQVLEILKSKIRRGAA